MHVMHVFNCLDIELRKRWIELQKELKKLGKLKQKKFVTLTNDLFYPLTGGARYEVLIEASRFGRYEKALCPKFPAGRRSRHDRPFCSNVWFLFGFCVRLYVCVNNVGKRERDDS